LKKVNDLQNFGFDFSRQWFAISTTNLLIALSFLSGQFTLRKLGIGQLGNLKLHSVFLAIAIVLFLISKTKSHFKSNIFENRSIKLLLLLIFFVILNGYVNFGVFLNPEAFDLSYIVLFFILVFYHIETHEKLSNLIFMFLTCSVIILCSEYYIFRDLRIVTNISTSRINIFLLILSLFAISSKKYPNILYFIISLSCFFILENSLKMNFITSALAIFFSLIAAFFIERRAIFAKLLLSLLLGAALAISVGASSHLLSRFSKVFGVPPGAGDYAYAETWAGLDGKETRSSAEMCSGSDTYDYCVSSEIKIFNKYEVNDKTERLRLWSRAVDLIPKNVWFGSGYDGYRIDLYYAGDGYPRVITYSYPHNVLLQYAVQYGIMGFSILLFIFIYTIYLEYKAALSNPSNVYILIGLFSFLLASMTGGDLFDIRYIFFFAATAPLRTTKRIEQGQSGTVANS
jgi:hypothetical protein